VIHDSEIRKRLDGAIDREGLTVERDRVARYVVRILVPEVKKMLREEERARNALLVADT
jgi:hypothetical protein